MEPLWLASDASEPLGVFGAAPRPVNGASQRAFELSSRGDRVTGELWLPAGRGPFPLVLHQCASGEAASAAGDAAGWLGAGLAVASVDLPLHGARASAKLSARLRAGLRASSAPDALAHALALDFARQAVLDLRRCLDALPSLARLEARRVAYAGSGLGAALGAHLCAQDPRPRAAVLAGAAGWLPGELDPGAAVARIGDAREVRWLPAEAPLADPPGRAFVLRALGLAPR